jgi:hypothetical protein
VEYNPSHHIGRDDIRIVGISIEVDGTFNDLGLTPSRENLKV